VASKNTTDGWMRPRRHFSRTACQLPLPTSVTLESSNSAHPPASGSSTKAW
jgi:hypothetical protein